LFPGSPVCFNACLFWKAKVILVCELRKMAEWGGGRDRSMK
jgi:hypothetical protein